jgi:hypothetical protein
MKYIMVFTIALTLPTGCFGLFDIGGPSASADSWEPEVENNETGMILCTSDGLTAGGILAIPVEGTPEDAEEICGWWSIEFFDREYEACCSGTCCTWGVGEGSLGLATDGEVCTWAGMCEQGLTCFAEGNSKDVGVCRLARLGEDCSPNYQCGEALFCDTDGSWDSTGTCKGLIAVEGQLCATGNPNPCLDPMVCVCAPGFDCRCWDGTEGDFCVDGTCQDDMVCVDDVPGHHGNEGPRCSTGELGTLCDSSKDCLLDYTCLQTSDGERCVTTLGSGSYCDPNSNVDACDVGLVCNDAFMPAVCIEPSLAGTPCLHDGHCATAFYCVEKLNQCWDGSAGSPCKDESDCLSGTNCLPHDGELWCTKKLAKGQTCDPEDVSSVCGPGLQCNEGLDPAKCLAPGVDTAPCLNDGDCALGYFCLLELGHCYDGKDGDPCSGDQHCAPGFKCHMAMAHCWDGNTGDTCLNDNHCAPGYTCDLELKQCFAGLLGTACETDVDCGDGLVCLSLVGENVCFEFLQDGASCDPQLTPFAVCDWGLFCDEEAASPICKVVPPDEA